MGRLKYAEAPTTKILPSFPGHPAPDAMLPNKARQRNSAMGNDALFLAIAASITAPRRTVSQCAELSDRIHWPRGSLGFFFGRNRTLESSGYITQ